MSLPIQQSLFHEATVFAKTDMKLKEAIFTFLTDLMTKGVLCTSETFKQHSFFNLSHVSNFSFHFHSSFFPSSSILICNNDFSRIFYLSPVTEIQGIVNTISCWLSRKTSTNDENVVVIYSPSCRFNPYYFLLFLMFSKLL